MRTPCRVEEIAEILRREIAKPGDETDFLDACGFRSEIYYRLGASKDICRAMTRWRSPTVT
jgi:hypothetical protein